MADPFADADAAYARMMTEPWHRLRLRAVLQNLLRHATIGPGRHWLDIGAGTGEWALLVAARGAEVTVVDTSPDMMRHLRRLADGARPAGHGPVRVLTAEALAAEAPRVDAVTLHNVLEYVPARMGLLTAAVRCLPTGGLLSVLFGNADHALYRLAAQGQPPAALLAAARTPRLVVGMPPERFAVEPYTAAECVTACAGLGMRLLDHRGVRVLSDLGAGQPSQYAPTWLDEMLEVEELLGGREPYRSSARHWHLILRKEWDG